MRFRRAEGHVAGETWNKYWPDGSHPFHEPLRTDCFDWDGTLMDSAAAIVRSIQAACRDLGPGAATRFPGPPCHRPGVDAMRQAVPNPPAERYPEMAARYRHHYLAATTNELFLPASAIVEFASPAGFSPSPRAKPGRSRPGLGALRAGADVPRLPAVPTNVSQTPSQMLAELMAEFAVEPEAP